VDENIRENVSLVTDYSRKKKHERLSCRLNKYLVLLVFYSVLKEIP